MYIYIVYKTTNLISGRFYIGRHKVHKDNIEDGYLGSGIAIRDAIKSYGKENFIRETLYQFDCEEDAVSKEAEIVHEGVMNDPRCYNLCTGGNGGRKHSKEARAKISAAQLGHKRTGNFKGFRDCTHTEETKRKISENKKKYYQTEEEKKAKDALRYKRTPEMRKKMSEIKKNISDETRRKMSEAGKARCAREKAERLSSA